MKITNSLSCLTLLMFVSLTVGCITTQKQESKTLLEQAELARAKAAATGHLWRLQEPSAGRGSVSLSTLLEIAQVQYEQRNYIEAQRLAKNVIQAARLGIKQARDQSQAAPYY